MVGLSAWVLFGRRWEGRGVGVADSWNDDFGFSHFEMIASGVLRVS